MIGAIVGGETAIFFRPVDAIAAVGAGATEQRRAPGVVDGEGRPLAREEARPDLALSLEKRALLAQLRGERDAREIDLLQFVDQGETAPLDARIAGDGAAGADGADAEGETGPNGLTEGEEAQVEKLKARDQEVRAHEQAHAAVGGQYAGAPSYTYQTGPDGRRYAVGGEVSIDVSAVPGDPQATIDKMRTVQAAALAPAEPSAQDRRVAQQAQGLMLEAMAEARAERVDAPSAATDNAATAEAAAGYALGKEAARDARAPSLSLAA